MRGWFIYILHAGRWVVAHIRMEWDPWFEQGDWESFQSKHETLLARISKAKELRKIRGNNRRAQRKEKAAALSLI